MMKSQTLLISLLATFALLAFMESSAVAAEFLWNGAAIAVGAELPTNTEPEAESSLLLEDMEPPGGAVDVLCSLLYAGKINAPNNGMVTSVVSLAGATNIMCPFGASKGACEGTEALMEAVNLPWLLESLLATIGGKELFLVDVKETGHGLPGYLVACKTILGTMDDTCTGETSAEVRNLQAGIETEFVSTIEAITPASECTSSAKKSGLIQGVLLTTDTTGGVLAVSE